MPALPAVDSVVRIEQYWQIGNDLNALTRWHARYSGTPPTNAACVAIATAINAFGASEWPVFLADDSKTLGVAVEDLSSATSGSGEFLQTVTGTRGSPGVGASMCVLANAHIARRYRGGKPRSYLPFGYATDLTTAQVWGASLVDNVTTIMNDLAAAIAAISSGGCVMGAMCSISYYKGFVAVLNPISGRTRDVPVLRDAPLVDDIVSWSAKAEVASQRRRNLQRT